MRHVYGSRFAETDEEKLLKQDIAELQRQVEHWRRIAETTPVRIVVEQGDYTEIVGNTDLVLAAGFSKLRNAMRTLVKAYTRDDHQIGFCIESSPMIHPYGEVTRDELYEAWATLRKELHEQTEPETC